MVLSGGTDTGFWKRALGGAGSLSDASRSTNEGTIHADNRSKVKVERLAQLIISSMLGPHALFFESWITTNPGLLWVFLASY